MRSARVGRGRTPRVVYQAASLVPRLPRRRSSSSGCPLLARRPGRAAGSPERTLDAAARPPRRTAARATCSARYVDVFDLTPQARALPVLLDRRRHPPPRRGAGPVQERHTGPAASSSTPTASCPTTCRWCWSSRRVADPEAGRELLQDVPPQPRAAADRAGRRSRAPYAGVRRRRVRDAARASRRPTAPPCRRWSAPGPPTESVGLEPYDPRLLPLQPVGGALMDVLLWGVLPYLVIATPGRRHDLALPLRQVRLDHPLVAALRVAAAADRVAAVPLRHPARASSGTSAAWSSPSPGPRRSASARASTTSTRCSSAASPGVCTLVGILILVYRRRTHRAGLHGHHANDKLMYVLLVGAIVLGLWTTLVSVGAGTRRTTTARPSRRGSARSSCCGPTSTRWRRRRSSSTSTRWSGCCCSPLWPFTRLVHAFTAPLHYLFRPYIVYRSRDRADSGADRPARTRLEPGRHPRPRPRPHDPTERQSTVTDQRPAATVDLRGQTQEPRPGHAAPSPSASGPGT